MPEEQTFSDLNGINGGRLHAVIESITAPVSSLIFTILAFPLKLNLSTATGRRRISKAMGYARR